MLKRQNAQIQRVRSVKKEEEREMWAGISTLAGAAGAALIDKKFGESGEQAKVLKVVPVNASIGTGITLAALLWRKMPMRAAAGGLGLGMACGSVYRYTFDNVNLTPSS